MLGASFKSRGPVVGISLGLLFGFQFLLGMAPWLGKIMPWLLTMQLGPEQPSLALALVTGRSLPSTLPIVATAVWCVLFAAVAVWQFNREEF